MNRTTPQYKEVTLTWSEVHMASTIASTRHLKALQKGRPDRHGAPTGPEGLKIHFEGACGEVAFAKATGRYWSAPVDTFKEPDFAPDIQVRTRSLHIYELIVRPDDADNERFVLVTSEECPYFRIVGWITGAEAKRPEWLATHGGREPAYFVPHAALRDLGELK